MRAAGETQRNSSDMARTPMQRADSTDNMVNISHGSSDRFARSSVEAAHTTHSAATSYKLSSNASVSVATDASDIRRPFTTATSSPTTFSSNNSSSSKRKKAAAAVTPRRQKPQTAPDSSATRLLSRSTALDGWGDFDADRLLQDDDYFALDERDGALVAADEPTPAIPMTATEPKRTRSRRSRNSAPATTGHDDPIADFPSAPPLSDATTRVRPITSIRKELLPLRPATHVLRQRPLAVVEFESSTTVPTTSTPAPAATLRSSTAMMRSRTQPPTGGSPASAVSATNQLPQLLQPTRSHNELESLSIAPLFGASVVDSPETRAAIFERFQRLWQLMSSRSPSADTVDAAQHKSPFECSVMLIKLCKSIGIAFSAATTTSVLALWSAATRDVDFRAFCTFAVRHAVQPALHHVGADASVSAYIAALDQIVANVIAPAAGATSSEPETSLETSNVATGSVDCALRLKELAEIESLYPQWHIRASSSLNKQQRSSAADSTAVVSIPQQSERASLQMVPSRRQERTFALSTDEARTAHSENIRRKVQLHRSWQPSRSTLVTSTASATASLRAVRDTNAAVAVVPLALAVHGPLRVTNARVDAAISPARAVLHIDAKCSSVALTHAPPASVAVPTDRRDDDVAAATVVPECADVTNNDLVLVCGACVVADAMLWCASCFAVFCVACWQQRHALSVDTSSVCGDSASASTVAGPLAPTALRLKKPEPSADTHDGAAATACPPLAMVYLPVKPLAVGKLAKGAVGSSRWKPLRCDRDDATDAVPQSAALPHANAQLSVSSHALLPALLPQSKSQPTIERDDIVDRVESTLTLTLESTAAAHMRTYIDPKHRTKLQPAPVVLDSAQLLPIASGIHSSTSAKPVAGDVRRRRQPDAGVRLPLTRERDEHDEHAKTASASPRRSSGKQYTRVPHARGLLLGVIAFYVLGLSFVRYEYTRLPPALDVDAPLDRFSEARARIVLENIMSFGYHPVGTRANEELIPNYLIAEIEKIRESAGPDVTVELDVQRPSGAFGLNFMAQFQNIYANVTNILVRISPANNTDALDHALMLSSHYDAAIGGAAASDDGVNIALMLELVRLFANAPPRFGALVFNFNGAEETIMQAAHGFITQHPWTTTIRAFINLEAAGAGGRELLFQTGSDELALAYAQGAKHPHASIVAQEIFQSGFITADTDFRIYRDFGAVAGMDFAYIENGYVYHTSLDDISRIQQGAVQRLGDNVVGVVMQLVDAPGRLAKVAATPESSNTLFFDVFGLAMVTMSKSTEYMLCATVLALALLYVAASPIPVSERLRALALLGRCAGAGLAATLLTALVLSLFAPLAWYSQLKLGAAMFVLPVLTGMVDQLIKHLERQQQNRDAPPASALLWQLEESLFEGVLLLWAVGLAGLMACGAISAYLPALWILFPLVGQVLCHALQRLRLLSTGVYVAISLAALAAPVLHTTGTFAIAFVFIMPLMGRSGTQLPPDLLIGVFFAVFVTIVLSYSGRFFCFFPVPQLKTMRKAFALAWVAVIVVGASLNPYTDDCPKRVMMQHVVRETEMPNGDVKTDAGLWLNALDYRGLVPLTPHLMTTQWRHLTNAAAPEALADSAEVYGHMPWALPVKSLLPEKASWYLPAAAPVIPPDQQRARLEVVSSKYSAETDRRTIHLHFTGPSHMNLFIDARNTTLTSWSIGNGVNGPAPDANDSYILQFCSGTTPSSFHFWIEAATANLIDAVVVGHHLEILTPEMRELKAALPTWYTTMDAVSTWRKLQL